MTRDKQIISVRAGVRGLAQFFLLRPLLFFFSLIACFGLVTPQVLHGDIRWMREHPANRFDTLKAVHFVEGVLTLEAEHATTAEIILYSSTPLVVDDSTGTKAKLRPGWDGTLGYSVYALEIEVPMAGEGVIKIKKVPPPEQPLSETQAESETFVQKLGIRASRFPHDPAGFRRWQKDHRAKLAEWLMDGGLPERVPLEARILGTSDYPHFTVRRVEYRSRPDRTNTLLLTLPKGVTRAPLMLALHGHEAPWGKADENAFRMGHPDDFCAYFAQRGWAVLQPATMDHVLQHKHWTLQGEWTWDAIIALDYAATKPEVDMSRVVVCGLSTGGHLAMNVLALDERVRAGVVGCVLSTWNHYARFRLPPHCDCGITTQLGGRLEQCDWAALAAPKPVQFQHGRQDPAFCPGVDPKLLDLTYNTGVMPVAEFDAMFSEVKRAYQLSGQPEGIAIRIHNAGHGVNNEWALEWLKRHSSKPTIPKIHFTPGNIGGRAMQ